jgi:levanbiose-producing levanase
VTVSIFLDAGSIEVFINDGDSVLSELINAPWDATSLNLNASGGSVRVSEVRVLAGARADRHSALLLLPWTGEG